MQRRRRLVALTAAALIAVVATAVLRAWNGREAEAFRPIDPAKADLQRGARLYAENCAACHGARLEGQPDWQSPGPDGRLPAPPHDASGHTWHHDDGTLFLYTTLGGAAYTAERGIAGFASGMPGFAGVLGDGEIRDILAFIKSRWPEDIRALQRETTARALSPDD